MSECINCGCNDVETWARQVRMGTAMRQMRCRHCGRTWWARDEPPKVIHRPAAPDEPVDPDAVFAFQTKYRCPRCAGLSTTATNTNKVAGGRGARQYRVCNCGHRFTVDGVKI